MLGVRFMASDCKGETEQLRGGVSKPLGFSPLFAMRWPQEPKCTGPILYQGRMSLWHSYKWDVTPVGDRQFLENLSLPTPRWGGEGFNAVFSASLHPNLQSFGPPSSISISWWHRGFLIQWDIVYRGCLWQLHQRVWSQLGARGCWLLQSCWNILKKNLFHFIKV